MDAARSYPVPHPLTAALPPPFTADVLDVSGVPDGWRVVSVTEGAGRLADLPDGVADQLETVCAAAVTLANTLIPESSASGGPTLVGPLPGELADVLARALAALLTAVTAGEWEPPPPAVDWTPPPAPSPAPLPPPTLTPLDYARTSRLLLAGIEDDSLAADAVMSEAQDDPAVMSSLLAGLLFYGVELTRGAFGDNAPDALRRSILSNVQRVES